MVMLLCAFVPLCHAGDETAAKPNWETIAQKRKAKIQTLRHQSYWNYAFAFSLGSCLRFNRLFAMPAAIISGIGAFKPSVLNNAKLMLFNDDRVAQITGNMSQIFQHKLNDLVKKTDELAKQKSDTSK